MTPATPQKPVCFCHTLRVKMALLVPTKRKSLQNPCNYTLFAYIRLT